MQIQLECCYADGSSVTLTDCLQFLLVRDRYQPCASLSVRMLTANPLTPPVRVRFSLGGRLLHEGCVRKCACTLEQKQFVMQLRAESYTAALTQNQLVPGLYTQVTLQQLMETYALPHITYQDVPSVRYVYVKENANMWDTIVAYNYKLCHGYPYIRVPNLLCMLPQTGTEAIVLPEKLTAAGTGGESSEMLSRIDMANAVGEYGAFTMDNPEAAARGIVRVRQILFDRQYAYDPEDALRFRIAVSNRKMFSKTVRYIGYCGEDLEDLAVCGDFVRGRVSRIVVTGDSSGIVTEDTFYFDPFCNSG